MRRFFRTLLTRRVVSSSGISSPEPNNLAVVGAWIFLSHSHHDIYEVRRIRNQLEEMGHFPILFFLKCLDSKDELDPLLQREIEARDFFLLCDSPNARNSRWVQKEVAFIKALSGKVYELVDLTADWEQQLSVIQSLSRRVTIFLSYSFRNSRAVERFRSALVTAGYRVLDHIRIRDDNWREDAQQFIQQGVEHGYVLIFIDPNRVKTPGLLWEVSTALRLSHSFPQSARRIVVVMLHAFDIATVPFHDDLTESQFLDLSRGSFKEKFHRLLEVLRR
jgi:TIR domain-containing protein